jgi:hypothetical protein
MRQAPDSNKPLSLADAFQLRQRQQQIDAEKALLPLKMQEIQQQITDQALTHTIKQEQFDTSLKMKANSAALWSTIATVKWDDPADISKFYGKVAEVGGLADPMILNIAEKNVALGQQYKLKEEAFKLKAMEEAAKEQATNARANAAILSREKIANANIAARADLERMKETSRVSLEQGKTVKWPEFLNRHLKSYSDATGKTPEEATVLLRKLYDENIGSSGAPGATPAKINVADPLNLFPQ